MRTIHTSDNSDIHLVKLEYLPPFFRPFPNRATPARADKPCEIGKQCCLWYKLFQLQSQYKLADMGLG